MTPRSDPSNQRNHFPLTAVILSFDYTRIANWLSVMVCVSKWGSFLKGIVHLHENLSQTNVFVRGIDQSCFSQTIFPWIYKSKLVNTLTNCSLCAIMKKREERKKAFSSYMALSYAKPRKSLYSNHNFMNVLCISTPWWRIISRNTSVCD